MAITHETNGKTKTKQRGPAYSPGAEQAVLAAQAEAAKGHMRPSPPHLFLGLLDQGEILPYLAQNGVDVAEARLYAEAAIPEDNRDERAFAQVIKYAGYEAWREASSIIQTQHLFIALIRQQKWSDFPGVLESLGLNLAELRGQSLSARKGHQKYATGHPLNQANKAAQAALDAAEAAMRATYCGRINSAHLLLGVLASSDSLLVSDLRQGGIDVAALQRAAREAIHQDGEIATSQRRFTPAAQRALDRARDFAERDGRNTWGPENLFRALMPQEISLKAAAKERLRYGGEIDDPAARVLAESGITFDQPAPQAAETAPAKASYTEGLKKTLAAAYATAKTEGVAELLPAHLLYGIAVNPDSLACQALQLGGANLEAWRGQVPLNWVQQMTQAEVGGVEWQLENSKLSQHVLEMAVQLSQDQGYSHTGAEHLLHTMLALATHENYQPLAQIFEGVDRQAALDFLHPHVIRPENEKRAKPAKSREELIASYLTGCAGFALMVSNIYLLRFTNWSPVLADVCNYLFFTQIALVIIAALISFAAKSRIYVTIGKTYIAGFVLGIAFGLILMLALGPIR